MEWFKKRGDTLTIIGLILGAFVWMNAQFTAVSARFTSIDERFSAIEKDVAIIKTVMIMNHHMPCEFAQNKEEK